MRSIVVAGLILAFTAVPAPALAQDPEYDGYQEEAFPAEMEVGDVVADAQGTYFAAPVTCTNPATGTDACNVTFTVSWQRTPTSKWAPYGEVHVVDQRPVSIPAGQTVKLESTVAPAKLRDVVSKANGAAVVTLAVGDGTPGSGDSEGAYVRPPGPKDGCGGATFLDVVSGDLVEEQMDHHGKVTWLALHSPQIARGTLYRVVSKTARVRYSGMVATAKKGTIFSVTCGGLSDYNNRRFFPLVHLRKGKVRVAGRPSGKGSFAAAVDTLEGNLGLRRRERADLVVTRNPRKLVSTMHVRKGRSGQITPTFHGAESSPCTNGSKLSVNIKGRIRRVR